MWAYVGEWITAIVHYLAMGYIVLGGFLIWRWRRTMWVHGAFIAWAVLSLCYSGLQCPLTLLENYFRHLQGRGDLAAGFVDTYITGILYPANMKSVAIVVSAILVLVSWIGAYIRWRLARQSRVDTPIDHSIDGTKLS